MPYPRLIPSLLLAGGRLVKGVRFGRGRDAGNPVTTARAHNAQGADELVLLDIHAAAEDRGPDTATIAAVAAECFMPLTVGGGIRTLDHAHACMAAGADRLSINAGARDDPALIERLARTYGSQAVVLGVDVVATGAGHVLYEHRTRQPLADRDALAWITEGIARGAGEVRLTAVDREGTRGGYDIGLLARVRAATPASVVVEGGAGTLAHLAEALAAGADGIALGTMLVFSDNNLVKIKSYLTSHGHPMRL